MKNCKVYKDGEHYIAIRHTVGQSGIRRKPSPEELIEVIDPISSPIAEECVNESGVSVEPKENDDYMIGHSVAEERKAHINKETLSHDSIRISTRSGEFMRWYRESV